MVYGNNFFIINRQDHGKIIGYVGVKTLGDIESKHLKMKPTLDPDKRLYAVHHA